MAATWDLLAPGAEVADGGALEIGGRAGRKIEVKHAADPRDPGAEPIAQRKWREARSVDDVTGEVVLDAERGVPLAVKLTGTIGFTRDGRRFAMKVSVDGAISGIGTAAMILPPPDGEVVATPERRREVDDRDYLLQGIAPPLRRNPDGTAIPPTPRLDSGELLRPGETPTGGARPTAPGATGSGDKAGARPAAKPGAPAGAGKPPARSGDKADPARRANPQDGAKP